MPTTVRYNSVNYKNSNFSGDNMKLSDYVASFVADYTKHVFMLPGGGCMHLVDSIGKEDRLSYVSCLHEQGAVIAADGYAQYNRELGVALVTTGPGGTNAVTGVAGAWVESVPLLVLSGQVKTADIKPRSEMRMLGFQEVDIVSIVSSITKYAVTVRDPKTIRYHLEKAIFLACSDRPGPVWIDVPLDVQAAEIDPTIQRGFSCQEQQRIDEKDKEQLTVAVQATISLLNKSERPVLIAGCGIKMSKSEERFRQAMKRLGIPVLTTWKGCDLISDDHPLFFGRPGTAGQRGANFTQQNADLILALGARLDFGQIGYDHDTFGREARKIVVDIDPLEFAKFKFKVDVPVVTNVASFLEELLRQLELQQTPRWSGWKDRCRGWKDGYPVVLPEYRQKPEFVSTYLLVDTISTLMTSEDVLVPCSSGTGADITMQSFRVKQGQKVLNSPGWGAMGFGVPHTIGACLASGRRRTVCLNGDGGFQLNIQELETIRRLGLPIKFFYLNNQGYTSIKTTQQNYFQGRLVSSDASSGLSLPDIRRISEAYGIAHSRIDNQFELEKKVQEVMTKEGPFICEVMIDPAEEVMPKVKSYLRSNGKMASKPLEDLAPFLDQNEFLSNMIVAPVNEC